MARVKSTTRLVDGRDGQPRSEVPSFEFGPTLVEEGDFDMFVERGWLDKENARLPEG